MFLWTHCSFCSSENCPFFLNAHNIHKPHWSKACGSRTMQWRPSSPCFCVRSWRAINGIFLLLPTRQLRQHGRDRRLRHCRDAADWLLGFRARLLCEEPPSIQRCATGSIQRGLLQRHVPARLSGETHQSINRLIDYWRPAVTKISRMTELQCSQVQCVIIGLSDVCIGKRLIYWV